MLAPAPYPPYYCPPGIELPTWCAWRGKIGPSRLIADASPDGQEGMYWGGPPYSALTKQSWRKTSAGWWILVDGFGPQHFAKTRITPGIAVDGHIPEHRWLVPQLLRWHPEAMLVCAVDEYRRDGQWKPPVELESLIQRLRDLAMSSIDGRGNAARDDEVMDMAIEGLSINYHICLQELEAAGWLTTSMVVRIINALCGTTQLQQAMEEAQSKASHG